PMPVPLGRRIDGVLGQPVRAALRRRRLHGEANHAPRHRRRPAGLLAVGVEARYLSEPGPLGLFTRITRVGLLVDAFQHRSLDPLGLLFIDYSVLRLLQLAGAPYRMHPPDL